MRTLHIYTLSFSALFLTASPKILGQTNVESTTLAHVTAPSTSSTPAPSTFSDCQTDRKNASFVRQKDFSGQDIEAFDLQTLRGNARYGLVEAYKEGYSRIKKDQVFGFLNVCGDEVVPCQYQDAEPFNDGKALVKKVDWYFVDAKNEESNALKGVTRAKALTKGVSIAYFQDGHCALINNQFDQTQKPISAFYNEITSFCRQEIFKIKSNGKFGLMDLAGKVLMPAEFDAIEECGVASSFKVTKGGKVGLADTSWTVRIAPSFDQILEFDKNGLAIVAEGNNVRLISNKTYKVSDLYLSISGFDQNKLAKIQTANGDFGLMNTELTVILTPQYRDIGDFNAFGLAPACRFEQKCGFINLLGKEIVPPQYSEVGKFTSHGVVVVKDFQADCNKGKGCTFDVLYNNAGQLLLSKDVNELGKHAEKIRFNVMDSLHNHKFISVQIFDDQNIKGFQLIDAKSFTITTKYLYSAISPFDQENLARVRRDGKWTLMDMAGEEDFEPTYIEIRRGSEGFYAVKNEKELFGFIDKKGKIQIPFEYDDVKSFRMGHCVVTKGREKWGLITKFNAKIIPLYFKTVALKTDHYEMTDDKGNIYKINDKGDCEGDNCAKFEELRKKANN